MQKANCRSAGFAGSVMPRTYSANASSCKLKCHPPPDARTRGEAVISEQRNPYFRAIGRRVLTGSGLRFNVTYINEL